MTLLKNTFLATAFGLMSALPTFANFVIPGAPGGYDVMLVNQDALDWPQVRNAVEQAYPGQVQRYSDRTAFRDARRLGLTPAGVLEDEDRTLMFLNKDAITPSMKDTLRRYFPNIQTENFREFDRGVSLAAIEYGPGDVTVTLGLMREHRVSEDTILIDIGGRLDLQMPDGAMLLTERSIDQGGVMAHNTVVQVAMPLDEIMTYIATELKEAGQAVEIIEAADRKSIAILEQDFRLAIAFEKMSDSETIVLVNVTAAQ